MSGWNTLVQAETLADRARAPGPGDRRLPLHARSARGAGEERLPAGASAGRGVRAPGSRPVRHDARPGRRPPSLAGRRDLHREARRMGHHAATPGRRLRRRRRRACRALLVPDARARAREGRRARRRLGALDGARACRSTRTSSAADRHDATRPSSTRRACSMPSRCRRSLDAGDLLIDARARRPLPRRERNDRPRCRPRAGRAQSSLRDKPRSTAASSRRRSWPTNSARCCDGAPPEQVIVMCGSGVTACHHLLAMERAGLRGASLFTGSWSGWIADPARPVATGDAEPVAAGRRRRLIICRGALSPAAAVQLVIA